MSSWQRRKYVCAKCLDVIQSAKLILSNILTLLPPQLLWEIELCPLSNPANICYTDQYMFVLLINLGMSLALSIVPAIPCIDVFDVLKAQYMIL